jgi:CRP-like cAMP-binding protein
MAKLSRGSGIRNLLLNRLPAGELQRLSARLRPVTFQIRDLLFEPNKRIDHVYFPEEGVASILTVLADGSLIEAATVGYEGMVGLPVFLGAERSTSKSFWQVPGRALALKADDLHEEIQKRSHLVDRLNLYTQAFFTQLAQSVSCNRVHNVEQRCARWLLMTHDRVTGDSFTLTHEFLAQMLGVRRAGVTEVAGRLQDAGLINYSRGRITIRSRKGLEKLSCECYRIVSNEVQRLLC